MFKLKGYSVLPVQLEPSLASDKPIHYIYLKKHLTKGEQESTTCSLFIVNLPVGVSFTNIKRLFSQVAIGANIESFVFSDYYDPDDLLQNVNLSKLSNPDFGQPDKHRIPVGCGILTFLDKAGLKLALEGIEKAKKPSLWVLDGMKPASSRLDEKVLAKQVASAMKLFSEREHEVADELQEMRETVDEDGFTLVVGPHRKTKSDILGSLKTLADLQKDGRTAKKLSNLEKKDFYRFQIRERKKEEVNGLLRKFKDDQERVKTMRERRKFNPY